MRTLSEIENHSLAGVAQTDFTQPSTTFYSDPSPENGRFTGTLLIHIANAMKYTKPPGNRPPMVSALISASVKNVQEGRWSHFATTTEVSSFFETFRQSDVGVVTTHDHSIAA